MAYIRKTRDEYQLLCNYGYGDGWEYVLSEDTRKEIKQRLKEYVENMPQYPYKVVKKRVSIERHKCKYCGLVITFDKSEFNGNGYYHPDGEEMLWEHIQMEHEDVFEEVKDWDTPSMIEECYD